MITAKQPKPLTVARFAKQLVPSAIIDNHEDLHLEPVGRSIQLEPGAGGATLDRLVKGIEGRGLTGDRIRYNLRDKQAGGCSLCDKHSGEKTDDCFSSRRTDHCMKQQPIENTPKITHTEQPSNNQRAPA